MRKHSQSSTKKSEIESVLALWLILFLIFEVLLLSVVLVRSFKRTEASPVEPPEEESTVVTDAPATPEEPVPAVPVFAGGAIPTRPSTTASTQEADGLSSNYAILMNAQTGEILASKQGDVRFSPASMTKVMTLIVACERLNTSDLDRKIVITKEIYDYSRAGLYEDSSLFGFDIGDEATVRDLLYGIGMKSASDCVVPIVLDVCESEEEFVALMNRRAQEMGLTDTHFDNAIGYESEQNYTTAAEMAMIMSVAMQCDLISDILCTSARSSQAYYYKDGVYTSYPISFYNSLHTQRVDFYKETIGRDFVLNTTRLDGGKTGYLDSSFLVCHASAKSGGGKYIVVLGDASGSSVKVSCGLTMKDLKSLLDTYVE